MKSSQSRIEISGEAPRGFCLFPDFISALQQVEIMCWIRNNLDWSGFKDSVGNPAAVFLETQSSDNRFPAWGKALAGTLTDREIFGEPPDHMNVIRYDLGKGITSHIDRRGNFGNVIAGLTLGSSRLLELTREESSDRVRILLLPGDLYVLKGPARHAWKHGIPAQVRDEFRGRIYERTPGISVTWRNLRRHRSSATETSVKSRRSWFQRR
jgi:2-oxoglutarate-Fe(II)-dependent oxygenase superfamily protein